MDYGFGGVQHAVHFVVIRGALSKTSAPKALLDLAKLFL
jgi:hypothetical protein